ncbi:MAG: hypothetical protein AAF563_12560 [Pseudomonadota bacterium]
MKLELSRLSAHLEQRQQCKDNANCAKGTAQLKQPDLPGLMFNISDVPPGALPVFDLRPGVFEVCTPKSANALHRIENGNGAHEAQKNERQPERFHQGSSTRSNLLVPAVAEHDTKARHRRLQRWQSMTRMVSLF